MQKILKNEKGSISLFVLLTAIFFLTVVAGVGVSLKNKENQIDNQFDKIKMSYEKDAEQVYNEVISDDNLTEEEKKEREVKKTTNIGKKVNFVSKYSNELIWRLFYADDDYVYLIASKIGNNGIDEISPQRTQHPSLGYLGLIESHYNDYSGSNAIEDNHLRSLNSLWFEQLGDTESQTESAKSVAWLMDQDYWKDAWNDENELADYVIGGPTAELFIKSFNSTAEINNAAEMTYSANVFGYVVNNNNSKFKNEFCKGIYTSNANEGDYNLFWGASPIGKPGDTMWEGKAIMDVYADSGLYFGGKAYGLGVRPIVIIKTSKYVQSNYKISEE